jgi:putative proteasome-type protease
VTYCLALRLHEGLVFLSDTRTNAGVDNIGTYRKLHVLRPAPDRVLTIQAAGSLATTQEVLDRVRRDLESDDGGESLASVDHLFEAALYLGRLGREVSLGHREALAESGVDATATYILGGQIGAAPPDILLVYPEGNYIRASDERPFLQIGESKYGKFMLELAVQAALDLDLALTIALGSMMSTARANLSVGPPYDGAVYLNDSLTLDEFRIESDAPLLDRLRDTWERQLMRSIAELQDISRTDPSFTMVPPPG